MRLMASGPLASQFHADCQIFARYVADEGFQQQSVADQPIFGSALHVEMALWLPEKPHLSRNKYRCNDAEHNAWHAMQQSGISKTFNQFEIARVFALIRNTFPTLQPDQCAITVFDTWHSQLLQTLRICGLGKLDAIGANTKTKPTTLATLGLAQKVVNVHREVTLSGAWRSSQMTKAQTALCV